uniref:Uncharacterized protein n=1 Tax=Opuntia streptacantha TaxID=393608 RepID=A0A7C9EN50_OPUST
MESSYRLLLLVLLLTSLALTKHASCARFCFHIPTRHPALAPSTTSPFDRFKKPESNVPQNVEKAADCSTFVTYVLKGRLGGTEAFKHALSKCNKMQRNTGEENNQKAIGDDHKIVHADL